MDEKLVVTETEVTDDGNGSKWTKGLVSGISLTAGLAIGIVGMGMWAGGVSATVEGHTHNNLIHQTPAEKEAKIREVVDREINPVLARIERRLDRIEDKLDGRD